MVSDLAILLVCSIVCESDKELTTRVGEEGIINISLNIFLSPSLTGLPLSMDGGNLLLEVSANVKVLPERLTICWVISSSVVLLSSIVSEWNTTRCEGKGDTRSESNLIVVLVHKALVVVVVNKYSKHINILEVSIFDIVSISDVVH